MKRTQAALIALGVALYVALAFSTFGTGNVEAASTRVLLKAASPRATVTPRPDQAGLGLPQPSPYPTCVVGEATMFADPSGNCILACQNGNRTVVKAQGACAVPTNTATATATPVPTVTSTP